MDISFLDFDVRFPLLTSDYIVGHKQDDSAEFRAPIVTLLDLTKQNLSLNNATKTLSITQTNSVQLTGFAREIEIIGLTWTPETDINLLSGVDFAAPFELDYNTNNTVFDLINAGETSPATRVHIKQPGYYEFHYQLLAFDLNNNRDYIFKLSTSTGALQPLSADRVLSKKRFGQNSAMVETSVEVNALVPILESGFYTVTVNGSSYGPMTSLEYSNENGIPTATLIIKKIRDL
jgi:hypothetical protein